MATPVGLEGNISSTTGCIAMEFGTGIHDPQRMKPNDFSVPLTFRLVPPAAHIFDLSNEVSLCLYKLAQLSVQTSKIPEGWCLNDFSDPVTFHLMFIWI